MACTLPSCSEKALYTCLQCSNSSCVKHTKLMFADGSEICQICFVMKLDFNNPKDAVVGCLDQPVRKPDPTKLALFGKQTMTYREFKKQRPAGSQLEHGVPNSNFIRLKGRKGRPIYGADDYTEDEALVFPVGDDQIPGTEHKFLTDWERAIDKGLEAAGQYATVDQKIRMMQAAWEQALLQFCPYKGSMGPFSAQIDMQRKKDAEEAAFALADQFREHFEDKLSVDTDQVRVKNGLDRNSEAPPKKLKPAQEYDRL